MKFFLALRLPSTWRIRYKVFNDVKLESYIYYLPPYKEGLKANICERVAN